MIVWLASYPRSGNTFLRILLKSKFDLESYSLYGDKRDIARNTDLSEIVGHQDVSTEEKFRELETDDELHVVKTHDMPPENFEKAIYVIRDGRDSCASYTHYLRDYSDVDATFLDVATGNVPFGTWSDHVKIWRTQPSSKVLFLNFEELTKNPDQQAEVIGKFLGLPVLNKPIPGFEDLQKIEPQFFRTGANAKRRKENLKTRTKAENYLFWLFNQESMASEGFGDDTPWSLRTGSKKKLFSEIRDFIKSLIVSMNENDQSLSEQILEGRQVIHNRNKIINARNAHIEEVKQLIYAKQTSIEEKQKVIDQKLARENDLIALVEQKERQLTNAREKQEAKLLQLEDMRQLILQKQATIDQLTVEMEALTEELDEVRPNPTTEDDQFDADLDTPDSDAKTNIVAPYSSPASNTNATTVADQEKP